MRLKEAKHCKTKVITSWILGFDSVENLISNNDSFLSLHILGKLNWTKNVSAPNPTHYAIHEIIISSPKLVN